jgi:hypothetical protein
MKILALSFVCMMLMVGCASTYTFGTKQSGAEYDFEELNRHIEEQECTVVLTFGDEKTLKGIVHAQDSVLWITRDRMSARASQISNMERVAGKIVSLTFTNGSTKRVQQVVVTDNSVSWIESSNATIPTSSIKNITCLNRTTGAFEGAGIGFLSGAGVGLLAAIIVVAQPNAGDYAGLNYIVDPVLGGVAGLLVGTIIGGVLGHTNEYKFVNGSEKP